MPLSHPRIGIALGAGAARGWAHIGVLRALEEADIKPHVVCGTSIGALVGATYANDRLDELEAWASALTWKKVIGFFDIGFGGGLLKGGRIAAFLHAHFLDKQISALARPYGAVAPDLQNGRELWLRRSRCRACSGRGPETDACSSMAHWSTPSRFPCAGRSALIS
jgi:NTE family protein